LIASSFWRILQDLGNRTERSPFSAPQMKVQDMNDGHIQDTFLWSEPVRVRVGYGFTEIIRGPREALEYLNWRWPVRYGDYYAKAVNECAACLQRRVPLDEVRETFILASIEAKMLE